MTHEEFGQRVDILLGNLDGRLSYQWLDAKLSAKIDADLVNVWKMEVLDQIRGMALLLPGREKQR